MEEINSAQNACEGLQQKDNQTLSGPSDTPLEPAPRAQQNNQGSSIASKDYQSQEHGVSSRSEGSRDQRCAARVDAESKSNLMSNAPGSGRTPAYSTYIEYIQQIRKKRPQYDDLLHCLTYEGINPGAFQILLADIGKDEVKSTILASDPSRIRFSELSVVMDSTLIETVVRCVKTPPKEDIKVRIIVLELACREQSSSRAIIDAIGSTYDVDPAFLNAFYCYNRNRLDDSQPHSPRSLFPKDKTFIRLHGCFVGQVMEKLHPSGECLKIVLILSWINHWDSEVQGVVFDSALSICSTVQEPLFQRSREWVGKEVASLREYGWFCKAYASWLSQLDQDQLRFHVLHPYEFIYPWIEYRIYDIVADTRQLRRKLNDIMQQKHFFNFGTVGFPNNKFSDDHLFFYAGILKDFVQAGLELRRILPRASNSNDKRSRRRVKMIQDSISDIADDSNYVLKSILDLQQTAIGTMAIQESRRSIKEAVSVKRLTQLAFVFIPLSYASSLFGMNINEMTGNGTKLWIFLVTSLALLISATLFWPLLSEAQGMWAPYMEDPGIYSFKVKIEVLYASMRTGNFVWMIREGILLRFLTTGQLFGDNEGAYQMALDRFYRDWRTERRERREKSSV